jgi:glycosyltransferase involved in cell wall biosynthesis
MPSRILDDERSELVPSGYNRIHSGFTAAVRKPAQAGTTAAAPAPHGPKVVILIPCKNERDHLPATMRDLPRALPGVQEIAVLVVDDGSADGTAEVARAEGAHCIIRFTNNRGLAAAHRAGMNAALRMNADILVTTDADNQYPASRIVDLIQPILEGRADMVIGDRQVGRIAHFSWLKRRLQALGSAVVRRVSSTNVIDATSGFRALSRTALEQLHVHNEFSYTLETIIQAGHQKLAIENLAIETNAKTRESRLFRSIPEYLRRNGLVIFRAAFMYSPFRVFASASAVVGLSGIALCTRFLYFLALNPASSGHVQSLLLGVGAIVVALLIATTALLSELLATNRRLLEESVMRLRRLERASAQDQEKGEALIDDIIATEARPWLANGSNGQTKLRMSSAPPPCGATR